jgi:hypothetical protein
LQHDTPGPIAGIIDGAVKPLILFVTAGGFFSPESCTNLKRWDTKGSDAPMRSEAQKGGYGQIQRTSKYVKERKSCLRKVSLSVNLKCGMYEFVAEREKEFVRLRQVRAAKLESRVLTGRNLIQIIGRFTKLFEFGRNMIQIIKRFTTFEDCLNDSEEI